MPRETLLIATRAGRLEHTPEAEPVRVETGDHRVVLVLDDGERITFDREELAAAVTLGGRGPWAAMLDRRAA